MHYSDIWACGIILYIILSGNHPFKATNSEEFYRLVVSKPVEFNTVEWKSVSQSAKTLIKGMLVKNPLKRLSVIELKISNWIKKFCKPTTKAKVISTEAM